LIIHYSPCLFSDRTRCSSSRRTASPCIPNYFLVIVDAKFSDEHIVIAFVLQLFVHPLSTTRPCIVIIAGTALSDRYLK
jgi:hypothetical protein